MSSIITTPLQYRGTQIPITPGDKVLYRFPDNFVWDGTVVDSSPVSPPLDRVQVRWVNTEQGRNDIVWNHYEELILWKKAVVELEDLLEVLI